MRMSDWSSDVCSSGLRASGGHLDSKGDPRESHSFAELVKAIGGTIPDPNRPEDIRPVLEIYGPGEYQAKKPAAAIASQAGGTVKRSEEHTSELQSLMRISYAVFCLKKKKTKN